MTEMAKPAEKPQTFRRFREGDSMWTGWPDLTDKIFQADRSYKCPTYVHRTPPCQGACPSGHDIRGWLSIARGLDKSPVAGEPWQQYAFRRMVEANPFPAVMGRVCPAPCEDGCNRNEVDEFVGINAVEHYVGDWAIQQGCALPAPQAETGKRVAVIGGGPAGLAAAYFLRRLGHGVTILEANEQLGGMLRYGIPSYRTPRDVVDAEIARILALGVEVRLKVRVGEDISLADIERDFDAVFWAIGAQKGRPLPVAGWGADGCITGVEFLDAFNHGWVFSTAKRIVVVGGGDTSVDVASVARRLGHVTLSQRRETSGHGVTGFTAQAVSGTLRREGAQVTLTSLFPLEQMTAAERERADALREGIDIRGAVMPLEILTEGGRVRAIRMCECTMKGMTPEPKPGTEFEIACDMVVSAIGQTGDLAGLPELDGGKGAIEILPGYRARKREKHFAGGDIVRPHLLTTAIGHGRVVADSIDRYLAGTAADKRPKIDVRHFNLLEELHQRGQEPAPYDHGQTRGTSAAKWAVHNYEDRAATQIIPHDALFKGHFKLEERSRRPERHVEAEAVLGDFAERIAPLTEADAMREGKRCLSCGMCVECDNCVIYCPQTAVKRVPKGERALGRYVYTEYSKCIGCHICADVCPTGYIQMGLGE